MPLCYMYIYIPSNLWYKPHLSSNEIFDHSDVVGASPYITFFAIYTQKGWARIWASLCVPISKHLTLGHPQTQCRLHISKVIARSYIFYVTSLLIRWYFSTWLTNEILRNLAPSSAYWRPYCLGFNVLTLTYNTCAVSYIHGSILRFRP